MTKFVSKAKLTYILAKVKALIAARVITWSEITGKPSTYTPSSHTHSYAGSSTAGGAATSANKLNTNAGSQTQPVYFVNGIPTVCTYALGKNVPSDAKFTDTVYTHPAYTARSSGLYKIVVDATGHVSGVTAVTKADITALGIPAQDTTYSNMTGATASAAGKAGLVPAPTAGKQLSFLRGDGTWVVPTDTKYTHPSSHPASMINVTIGTSTVALSDVIACAVFPISQGDGYVEFGNITEWLAANKPKL